MIRRAGRAAAPVAVLAAVLGLAGCSSGTAGRGSAQGSFTPVATEADSPAATASPSMTSSGGGMGGGGGGSGQGSGGQGSGGQGSGGGGGSSTGGTKSATPTRTATTDPNAMAELLSFEVTSGPNCAGTSGSSKVTMSWRTRAVDEVWIQITPVAVAASDPKTTPGSSGPLPPNGSRTLPFDCAGQYDYYNIGVYNRGNGSKSGQVKQVPRNI